MSNMTINADRINTKLASAPHNVGRLALEKAITLYVLLREEDMPRWAKVAIATALAYLICPIDAVPDFLPGGLLDDIAMMVTTVARLHVYVTPAVKAKVRAKLPQWCR